MNVEFKTAWIASVYWSTEYPKGENFEAGFYSFIVFSEKRKDTLTRKYILENKKYLFTEIKLPFALKSENETNG